MRNSVFACFLIALTAAILYLSLAADRRNEIHIKREPVPLEAANMNEAEHICTQARSGHYSAVPEQLNIRIGTNPYGLICITSPEEGQ